MIGPSNSMPVTRRRLVVALVFAVGAAAGLPAYQRPSQAEAAKTDIPLAEVRAIVAACSADVPAPFTSQSPAAIENAWIAWRDQQRADVRRRLERGDEDSLVNLWLYGTSFTRLPRATAQHMAALNRDGAEDLLIGRLNDLVAAWASPAMTNACSSGDRCSNDTASIRELLRDRIGRESIWLRRGRA